MPCANSKKLVIRRFINVSQLAFNNCKEEVALTKKISVSCLRIVSVLRTTFSSNSCMNVIFYNVVL